MFFQLSRTFQTHGTDNFPRNITMRCCGDGSVLVHLKDRLLVCFCHKQSLSDLDKRRGAFREPFLNSFFFRPRHMRTLKGHCTRIPDRAEPAAHSSEIACERARVAAVVPIWSLIRTTRKKPLNLSRHLVACLPFLTSTSQYSFATCTTMELTSSRKRTCKYSGAVRIRSINT